MRQYQLWVSYLIDIVTLPEHCQMYPLLFDRMNGAKHLVVMIWTVYKIVMKFYG